MCSLVCTLLVICHFNSKERLYTIIPNTCPPSILTLNALYITYGLQCLPEYIVVDELFPLGLIVLILD
uniref:Ovule protein n=1 Tax=Acrobeloides nanus TaxID=290746 RepID=A0A914DUX0_9BILA